jgi:hypothetical protein
MKFDKADEQRYQAIVEYFDEHPNEGWQGAQQAVAVQYARTKAPDVQHYARELPASDDEVHLLAIDYQRSHPWLSFCEAARELGATFIDEPARLDVSGLVVDKERPRRHDYVRQHPQGREVRVVYQRGGTVRREYVDAHGQRWRPAEDGGWIVEQA